MRYRCLLVIILLLWPGPLLAGEEGLSVQVLADSLASWNGAGLPAYPKGAAEIHILRIRIPPGAKLPLHKHPVINAGVLLSGSLEVTTEAGKTLRLGAGEPIVEVVDTWHSGENVGSEPADIIVFYAAADGQPITVLKEQEHAPSMGRERE